MGGGEVPCKWAGQWQRVERRQVAVLSWEAVLLPQGPCPCPSAFPPPSPLPLPVAPPPHTPQGSQFRFAVESLRGLIPSSITLHFCGGAPLVYFLSPGCPRRTLPLPHPSDYSSYPGPSVFSPNHFFLDYLLAQL